MADVSDSEVRRALELQLGRRVEEHEFAAHAQRLRRKLRALARVSRWEAELRVVEPANLGALLDRWIAT